MTGTFHSSDNLHRKEKRKKICDNFLFTDKQANRGHFPDIKRTKNKKEKRLRPLQGPLFFPFFFSYFCFCSFCVYILHSLFVLLTFYFYHPYIQFMYFEFSFYYFFCFVFTSYFMFQNLLRQSSRLTVRPFVAGTEQK
jgi:hypothetical protein